MDGKEYPESFSATWTRFEDGRGLATSGPSHIPRTHIPPKPAKASKAARHPVSFQESPTVSATRTRFHGNLAVEEIHCAHPVDAGVIPWTKRVMATSPGKYGKYRAPITTRAVRTNTAIHDFPFMSMLFSREAESNPPFAPVHIILNNLQQVKYTEEAKSPIRALRWLIRMNELNRIAVQIAAVLIFSASLAFISNAARDNRLPLVMPFPPSYQCPSSDKPGLPVDLHHALEFFGKPGTVFVDARKRAAFQQGHIEGARHVPYSFVEPVSQETLDGLRGYTSVIVYCNREDSEAGKLLAGELAQAGIKGVVYLEKGFAGWVKAGGRYTGKAPEGYDQ
jgi:rhodanese-related sulfurtransferase